MTLPVTPPPPAAPVGALETAERPVGPADNPIGPADNPAGAAATPVHAESAETMAAADPRSTLGWIGADPRGTPVASDVQAVAPTLVARDVEPPPTTAEPRATIVVERVSRWYGNVVAINDISISIGPGITGLLGPNGAGKSTLLHLAAGLLRPSTGTVRVLGATSWRNPDVYRQIGLVPEREAVYPFLTGREFVQFNATLQRMPEPAAATARALRTVDLEDAADRPIGTYSKGMRQRVKVAAGLVHDPQVLMLDEPFNGMDPRQRLHMMELLTSLAGQGRTILFSSHILEEVERLAQSVLVIVAGRLAASGDFREIRRLMTDRPHTFTIHSSDNRRLAAALLARDPVFGVELGDGLLTVRASDYAAFTRLVARVARDTSVSLYELRPTDESLESVFQYLVQR